MSTRTTPPPTKPTEAERRRAILNERIAQCPEGLDPRGWFAVVIAVGETAVQHATPSRLEDPYLWASVIGVISRKEPQVHYLWVAYRRALEPEQPLGRTKVQICCQTDEDP